MQDFQQYHKVIKERVVSPSAICYADPWWDAETRQFTLDVGESIRFIEKECTDEELYWLGEIFDDIMDKTRSREFLECLRRRVQKVEDPKKSGRSVENRGKNGCSAISMFFPM